MKHTFLVFAIVLALLLPFSHAEKIWAPCLGDRDNDILQISNIDFSPDPPISGEDFSVTIVGNVRSAITHGSITTVAVLYGDIPLFEGKIDLCDLVEPTLSCPITPGPLKITIRRQISGIAPPGGPYNGNISIFDQSNKPVTCINFRFNMDILMANPSAPALDNKIIQAVNNDKSSSWSAQRNPVFEGQTVADVQKKLGARGVISVESLKSSLAPPEFGDMRMMADSFDWRVVAPQCVHPIRDQGRCGSCWAMGAAAALSDRFCIGSKGAVDVVLSPEFLVDCDRSNFGCSGGFLSPTWRFLASTGVPTEECYPYTAGDGVAGECMNTCVDNSPLRLFKTKDIVQPRSEKDIQDEISRNGPVEAAFSIYQDFLTYKSGVYRHMSGNLLGGHAVKLIGWGVDHSSGLEYWIAANSWGNSWGMGGYFWISRGFNECGIEANVIAGLPVFN